LDSVIPGGHGVTYCPRHSIVMSDADECFHRLNTVIPAVRYELFILHRIIRRDILQYDIRSTNYGILLSVSLLGSSSISTVSISAIISC
jgi:hypothetical protein